MASINVKRLVIIMPFYGKEYLIDVEQRKEQRQEQERSARDGQKETILETLERRVEEFGLKEEAARLIEQAKECLNQGAAGISEACSIIEQLHVKIFEKLLKERLGAEETKRMDMEYHILLPNCPLRVPIMFDGPPAGKVRKLSFYRLACRKCLPTIHFIGGHLYVRPQLTGGYVFVHRIHKGDAVRLVMKTVVSDADREKLEKTLVLHIDGTGISLRSAIDAIEKFVDTGGDGPMALLGLRPLAGYWGISPWRKIIELWENYLIARKMLDLDVPLPDAQCGLWCLRGNVAHSLVDDLVAHRFELELDIVLELLLKGYVFDYVDVELEDLDDSGLQGVSGPEEELYKWAPLHADKLSLIVSKLGIDGDELAAIFKGFQEWLLHNKDSIGCSFTDKEIQRLLNGYRGWSFEFVRRTLSYLPLVEEQAVVSRRKQMALQRLRELVRSIWGMHGAEAS